ncbi:MAG: YdcF family protein [Bacteroidia bacterium]
MKRKVKAYAKIFTWVIMCWFVAETCYTSFCGFPKIKKSFLPDCIVVFGNKVNEDGTLSKRLKARMEEGLRMQERFPNAIIFVSGGLGKEGHLEGSKMASYLIENGVSKNQIVIDNNGNNSLATIEHLKAEYGNSHTLFVSQFYHIRRIELLATKLGLNKYESSAPAYFEFRDFYALFREFFAIYKYKLLL